jgi:hypothetical protein
MIPEHIVATYLHAVDDYIEDRDDLATVAFARRMKAIRRMYVLEETYGYRPLRDAMLAARQRSV